MLQVRCADALHLACSQPAVLGALQPRQMAAPCPFLPAPRSLFKLEDLFAGDLNNKSFMHSREKLGQGQASGFGAP